MIGDPWLLHFLSGVSNHLWQSTLFAAIAAALAFAFRQQPVRVRFWLWMAASLKFLIPFALLAAAGSYLPLHSTPRPAKLATLAVLAQPFQSLVRPADFSSPGTSALAAPTHAPVWPLMLVALWLVGFVAVAASHARDWRKIAKLARRARVASGRLADLPLRVAVVSGPIEPGVFGVFHPTLLLPDGMERQLSPTQLEGVVAHEFCHIRRRDNLWAYLHMAVEAIFWFHPLVWWLGGRIIAARELACDEAVLAQRPDAKAYAEAILSIHRFCICSPSPCVAGITGDELQRRIAAIMNFKFKRNLSRTARIGLASAALAVVTIPVAAGRISMKPLSQATTAQAAAPSYGAVSVKPSAPNERGSRIGPGPEGGLLCTNDTVSFLISYAYSVQSYQIIGAPGWVSSNRYDVTFTAGETEGPDYTGQMDAFQVAHFSREKLRLQQVLRDRFGLVLHEETRTMPVYALTQVKPRMKIAAKNEPTSFSLTPPAQVTATAAPIWMLTRFLARVLQHPVNDATGLSGLYDFTLTLNPSSIAPLAAPPGSAAGGEAGPSLFAALGEQLGLKLESKKGPAQVYVVDKVEKPAEN